MAVTNSWSLRNATPLAQLRPQPSPCSDSSSSSSSATAKKKEINLNFVCSILNRPISIKARNLNLSCRCSSSSSSDWDWTRWSRRFSEIEETENTASFLKIQLKDAIEKEDFEEAVKLKKSIEEASSEDSIAEIMSLLKNAIDEERYHDASKLCQVTKKNLIGWWVGCSKDFDDPFGRVIRITPGVGRFVAKSYTPRQLVTGSSGTPLFEIFVVKDADQEYITQVVCFKRAKGSSTDSSSPSKVTEDSPTPNSENSSTADILGNEEDEPDKDEEVKSVNIKDTSEEGIKGVLNFLKDKIPGLKVKVMNVNVSEEILEDSESVEQLLQENEIEKKSSAETSEDETDILEEIHPEGIQLKGGANTRDEIKSMAMKLFIGGESNNKKDTTLKDERVRYPAEIRDVERDSFVLHIPKRNEDFVTVENTVSKVNIEDVAAKEISELMPRDVAHAFWSVDKPRSKVAKDVREIIKLAVSQAHKHNRLSKNTTFRRIPPSNDNLDPLEGLFVGSFGPYGPEVVQLTRKFGHWHVTDDKDDLEFFEYVEAVKLTGDLNVPVGQVTFRAKIGKSNRISNRGRYPDELGVVSSYKGQGRIAEVGFRNPQWVGGELLQLRGKGMGPHIRGADLGFLYVVPEQSFLVLFNRLKLPEYTGSFKQQRSGSSSSVHKKRR